MHQRTAQITLVALVCATTAPAQSTVRPLPRMATVPAATLALSPRSFDARMLNAEPAPVDLIDISREPKAESYLELEMHGRLSAGVDFSESGGGFDLARGGWSATLGRAIGEDSAVTVQLETEASFYHFSGMTALVPGSNAPLNDVYRTSLGVSMYTGLAQPLGWFTGFEVGLGGEDEASLGDAMIVGGVSGVRYRANENLALTLGLASQSRLEGKTWVAPFLGFDWRIDDDLRLWAQGSQVELSCALNEHWSTALSAEYAWRQYRLNDENPLPGGVFRDEEIELAFELRRKSKSGVALQFQVGTVVWQELNFIDSSGDNVSETETEPSLFASFGLSGRL